LLRQVPLSRRVLERQFTHYLGRSPHAEILRVRLGRVKQLLVETDLSVEAIAHLAGFEHPEYLSVAFKREVGLRPRAYRVQHDVRLPRAE
jgi:LacI family transcriptional regulator